MEELYNTPWVVDSSNANWPNIRDCDGIRVDIDDADVLGRIVACVNACDGVDTEELTHGCYQKLVQKHVEVCFAKQDAEAQRDELLAALKGILSVVSVRIDDPRIQQFDAALAAIAKVGGGDHD